jgi:GT2 family glycosyltransferase
VIPAHNERSHLPACLASVREAAGRVPIPVDIVVVLDACTDGSHRVVRGPFRTVSIDAGNVGAARAAGFALTAPDAGSDTWFATTDADTVVPIAWLENQVAHHEAGAEAVVGTVRVDWRNHSDRTRLQYEQRYGRAEFGTPHGHVHGANLGFRADAYWRSGGFRALAQDEDVDLVERLESIGAQMKWDRSNAVLTSDRTDSRVSGGFGDYVKDLAG